MQVHAKLEILVSIFAMFPYTFIHCDLKKKWFITFIDWYIVHSLHNIIQTHNNVLHD